MVNERIREYFLEHKRLARFVDQGASYLLSRWGGFIDQLKAEYKGSIDDYRYELSWRTAIEEILPLTTESERKEIIQACDPLDEQFRAHTAENTSPVVRQANQSYWWNYRVPPGMKLPGADRQRLFDPTTDQGDDFPDFTKNADGTPNPEAINAYIQKTLEAAKREANKIETGVDPSDGTVAVWDGTNGIIIIIGRPGVGMAFKPRQGRAYFEKNFPDSSPELAQ